MTECISRPIVFSSLSRRLIVAHADRWISIAIQFLIQCRF